MAKQTKKTPDSTKIITKIVAEFQDRNRAEIQKWRQALALANDITTPRNYVLQDLYENLKSDGHFLSQIDVRKSATKCTDFQIINKSTGEPDAGKTAIFKNEWFFDFIDMALDNIFFGYSVLELDNAETLNFNLLPRRNTCGKKQLILFEASGDKGVNIEVGFENTLIHCGKKDNLGRMADLCGLLIWKRNAQQSWAEFSEKFGMPLISATTNKTSPADLNRIEAMLRALGEAAQAVLPEGTSIDIKPFAGSDSFNVYDKQIVRINEEISKPLIGGTMVTDDGASRSQAEVHERTLDDKIALMDKFFIEFIVNNQLLALLQYWGYPVNSETDKFEFLKSFELTLKEHWDIVKELLDSYEIDEKWLAATFNIPILGRRKEPVAQTPNLSANFR